ncbi:MAG TPA: hypothetical protein VNS09_01410 [Solirubrobacter sp.]|nr:hypothetical protein [Solirubrobacter sp.]
MSSIDIVTLVAEPGPPVLIALAGAALTCAGARLRRVTASPAPSVSAREAPAPVGPGARDLEAVEPLSRVFDRSRRLMVAEHAVARELAKASACDWMIERAVIIGAHRVPFVVLGPAGVFVMCATDGAWTQHDLEALSSAGDAVRGHLVGYDGPVHAVVCLAFDQQPPRTWQFAATGWREGWLVGLDDLWPWMNTWPGDEGINADDVRRLDFASGPRWDRDHATRLARHVG